jgi:hypothetical protein
MIVAMSIRLAAGPDREEHLNRHHYGSFAVIGIRSLPHHADPVASTAQRAARNSSGQFETCFRLAFVFREVVVLQKT